MNLRDWEEKFIDYYKDKDLQDGSHDIYHFKRVWKVADQISDESNDKLVILAACYFHDLVSYPKNHPDRSLSSLHAANKANEVLTEMNFPTDKLKDVAHAIHAHSFSADVKCETEEARVVQDADRMEAIGAIGLARAFYVSGMMGSKLFDGADPFSKKRDLDDKSFALDHFYTKLFKLPQMMQTKKGKEFAKKRADVLERFVADLKEEI